MSPVAAASNASPQGVQFTAQLQGPIALNKNKQVQSKDAREAAVEMMGKKKAKMQLRNLW